MSEVLKSSQAMDEAVNKFNQGKLSKEDLEAMRQQIHNALDVTPREWDDSKNDTKYW